MSETLTVDPELARGLLDDVLDRDAADGPGADPPPRVPWLNEDGSPRWGVKADGSPRRAKPGTGRPRLDDNDKPRTTGKPPPQPGTPGDTPPNPQSSGGGSGAKDYSEDIGATLTMVWMGLASVPFTRAHAAIVRAQTPAMVPAWNTAAQQNATIRKYVQKLSGEGSWAWVIPVTITTTPLAAGMWQVTRDASLRAALAKQTEKDFAEFIAEQATAAGMDIPEMPAEPPNGFSTDSQGTTETSS
ncbi:MAG TPA: hypothetical protein VNV62_18600 [Trebonia sp.]|jgi:hypothetical protein|nr:hypothetical protein [Trebonia sp.]